MWRYFFLCLFALPALADDKNIDVLTRWVLPSRLGARWEMRPQERTKPIVVGDILYFGNLSGEVYAMHRTEGYELWKTKLPAGVEGALTYARSKIYVGDLSGNLYALNARDGSEAWHFKIKSQWLAAPAVLREKVFVATSSEELYALNESDGKEVWHYSHRGDEKMTIRGTGAPVVYGNEVYHGFSDGYLVALSAPTGKVLWEKKLRQKERFYDIDMAPFVDDKSVVAATFDGRLYSLDRLTGDTQWLLPMGSYGGFLAEEDQITFAALNGNVLAVNRSSGTVRWKTAIAEGVGQSPVRVGSYIAVTTSGDPVYLLQPSNGQVVWTGRLGTGTLSPAAAATGEENWFYCLSNYGVLYSFEIVPTQFRLNQPETVHTPSAIERHRVESKEIHSSAT